MTSLGGRLLVAVLLAGAALLLRGLLDPLLGAAQPYAAGAAAIAAAVWFCGWMPASVTALLITFGGNLFYLGPRGTFSVDAAALTGGIGFLFSAAVIIFLGEQLRRANARLRRRAREKDLFLAMLSHELRNPVAAIRNTNEILRRANTVPEVSQRAAELQNRQIRHLVKLIDDLVDANRYRLGRLRIKRELIDVRECIEDAIQGTRGLLDECGKKLVVDVPDCVMPVRGDASRIHQVIVNLLGNASKYSPEESRIELRATAKNGCVEISVSDSGIGIDPALMPHIFDLFFIGREHLSGKHGLGLGLWLARNLVKMHGGTITAESEGVGKGSRFTVRLPLAETSSVHSTVSLQPLAPGQAPKESGAMTQR